MLKALHEDGYTVTAYERRDRVGGLWAYTENTAYTTALQSMLARIWNLSSTIPNHPSFGRNMNDSEHLPILGPPSQLLGLTLASSPAASRTIPSRTVSQPFSLNMHITINTD